MEKKQEELMVLVKEKDEIEEAIKLLNIKLDELNKKGYGGNYVDKDGFPREDLDFGLLTEYKNIKRTINEKQNDFNQLMTIIEKGLHSLHNYYKESGQVEKEIIKYEQKLEQKIPGPEILKLEPKIPQKIELNEKEKNFLPFSQITEVVSESPAEISGLKINDLISNFGECDYYNNDNLNFLSQCVKNNNNKETQLIVYRENENIQDFYIYKGKKYEKLDLIIKPQIWKGQGLLGCRFKPIS